MKKYQKYQDNELLPLIATGDEHAFAEVYYRYWKLLFAIAFTRLKHTQLAEDVVHDVFASLWKNRNNSEIVSLENYLASATKYMVFAVVKKHAHEFKYRETQTRSTTGFNTEDALHHKLLIDFVKREVAFLPEKCRLIFTYSRDRGMTTKEIAEELKITTKTVENQINKALHHLRFSMRKMLQVFL